MVEQAIEKQKWTIGIYPYSFMSHMNLGDALLAKSIVGEDIQEYEKAVQLSGENPMAISGLACAYHVVGKEEEAKKLIRDLLQRMEKEYVQASIFIPLYILTNDLDQAYHWMDKAYNDKELNFLMYIVSLLAQNRLPEEARFRTLVEQTAILNARSSQQANPILAGVKTKARDTCDHGICHFSICDH